MSSPAIADARLADATCLVVIAESAPAELARLADLSRELGAEVQTVVLATARQTRGGTPAVDDWHAVLARSRRLDPDAIRALELRLAGLGPLAASLSAKANGRPLLFLGEAAVLGALTLAGSYGAISTGSEPSEIELLGLHHADEIAATSLAAMTSLGELGLFAASVVPTPLEPQSATSATTAGTGGSLALWEPHGLNPEVSFAVLEALVDLNAQQQTDLFIDSPADEQTTGWARNLAVDGRLIESTTPPPDAIVLCTSSDPDQLVAAAQVAEAGGSAVVSVFEHPLAHDQLGTAIGWGSTGPTLAAAIANAPTATPRPSSPETSISGRALVQTITSAAALAAEPGPAFRAVRQKLWELRYEGESADGYDDKYHAAACYVELDQELAALVGSCLPPAPAPRRILDLGCGPGSMIPFLQELNDVEIVGVDISPAMLDHARERFPEIPFDLGATDAIPHGDATFDVVLVSGVLHHLPALRSTLEEISRVLTPTGWLVVREPNEDNMSHRNPDLALAHQCIRSLVLDRFGHRPVWEPEAHDDHTDFTPALLAEALATVFAVETVATGGVVSYFHDTLTPEQLPLVSDIESTLTGQPGLNLFIAARQADVNRADDTSISPGAIDALRDLDAPPPISADHIDALLTTAGDLLADAGVQRSIHDRITAELTSLPPDALVLDIGDHPLTRSSPTRSPVAAGEPLADVVSVVIEAGNSASGQIDLAASRVRDHGWLVIDVPSATGQVELDQDAAALVCVAVEPLGPEPAAGYRVAARRHALAPVDLVTALENVLDNAASTIEPVSAERLDGWRSQVDRWRIQANWQWAPSAFARNQRLADVLITLTSQ